MPTTEQDEAMRDAAEMALATPASLSDEALAKAALDGDRRAFTLLVERYRGVVFAYAVAALGSRDEAEDIAQEAFVRAFETLPRFRLNASWGAWLMTIARNLCRDALRRRAVRGNDSLSDLSGLSDISDLPEAQVLARQQSAELERAVVALPEKYRIPLLMHYSAKRTYPEIALALGLPRSTVVGRLAGALRLLRRSLREEP